MEDLGLVENVHEDNINLLRLMLKPDIMGACFAMLLKRATLEDILERIEWIDETNEDDKPTEQERQDIEELCTELRMIMALEQLESPEAQVRKHPGDFK